MPTRKGWGYIAAVVAGGYLSLIEAIRFHMEQGGLSPRDLRGPGVRRGHLDQRTQRTAGPLAFL